MKRNLNLDLINVSKITWEKLIAFGRTYARKDAREPQSRQVGTALHNYAA
jgi:hypothetical protein